MTKEPWYAPATAELAALDRKAEAAFHAGNQDQAAALIKQGEAIETRLLSARDPTLEAVQAVSDLDQLYGDMLETNHNCGWAEMFFQKNIVRWKHWTPQTPDSDKRLKLAQKGVEECDKRLLQ